MRLTFLLLMPAIGAAFDPKRALFLVRSGAYAKHEAALSKALAAELEADGVPRANVRLLHELGAEQYDNWCLMPWMKALAEGKEASEFDWFVFADANTRFKVPLLSKSLGQYKPQEPHFVGHRLQDTSMAIIHHYFTDKEFGYPHMPSGFALSRGALAAFAAAVKAKFDGRLPHDTHIDVVHETAKFLWANLEPRLAMTDDPAWCNAEMAGAASGGSCAAFPASRDAARVSHGLQWDDVVIAVKTTAMFHAKDRLDRLQVIKATWGKDAPCDIVYASDAVDPSVPTIDIGVNTKKGHCAKTQKILEMFNRDYGSKKWFVIADDDTLFYLPRLKTVLDSYDPAEAIYLGER
eukprot:g5470.t1